MSTSETPADRTVRPLSVVIPTLGGVSLAATIRELNRGPRIPSEILVCIPPEHAERVKDLAGGNVKIVPTPRRGQVAQRAHGFSRAAEPIVLQLDDDISIAPDDLARLIGALEGLGRGNAVAPLYRDSSTGQCLHAYSSRATVAWLKNVFASVVCGAPWGLKRMGTISPAGTSYGIDPRHCDAELVETQWQPGGCVVCYRDELVVEDYFPFPGKAYCEDAFHSLLRKKRAMRLWVLTTAVCATPAGASDSFDWSAMRADLKVRRQLVEQMGGQAWRLRLWFATEVVRRFLASRISGLARK
jgi:hypothetical protein